MRRGFRYQVAALGLGMAALVGLAGCELGNPTATPVVPTVTPTAIVHDQATATTEATAATTSTSAVSEATATNVPEAGVTPSVRNALVFADYKLEPVTVKASVQPYTVQPALKNVVNASDFKLDAATSALIEKNAFAVRTPEGEAYKQFYQLYEDGRYSEKPIFVTTDSVLHVYHLLFDKLLRSTETKYLISDLKTMTAEMLKEAQAQFDALKGTSSETAAKRNLAYFAVAQHLLDPNGQVPDAVNGEVSTELRLIEGHAGPAQSAVMGIDGSEFIEEYGQYKPRGHYTRSEELQKYFKAMMWYGRMTFRLKSIDETKSALLITQILQNNKTAADNWEKIYEPTTFFVGGSDDLTYRDYAPPAEKALGSMTDPKAVADDAKVAQFQQLAKSLAGPRINSMWVWATEDKELATKGLRMMGQRFTLDEYVFGQLIWREVGDPNGTDEDKRWLPKGLDVPAAMGSEEAYKILDGMGETKFLHYPEQMQKVRTEIAGLPTSQWTENLYWSWLYTFRPLLEPKGADSGYPSFMTNDAWTRKDLNTVLGSWTELKHDTLLYAKQVMAEMGGGPPEQPKGYVEPEPEFYARVAALVAMTRDGLLSRGLLEKPADNAPPSQSMFVALQQLEDLALDLKAISEKELEGKALSDEQYTLIQYYGGRIEGLTIAASDAAEGASNPDVPPGDLNDQDAAVVADVATGNMGATALEEGTGRIMEVYVVAPVEGKLVMSRGGVYSQYEFVQPSSNRLTDEQWRQMLDNGQAPPLADWQTFVAK